MDDTFGQAKTLEQGLARGGPGRSFGALMAGACSVGAGLLHTAASQTHADQAGLSWSFLLLGVAQVLAGAALLRSASRRAAAAVVIVNTAAVGGWLATRLAGIGWIAGLEQAEAPQQDDLVTAVLGAAAVVVALAAALRSSLSAETRAVLSDRLGYVGALVVVPVVGLFGLAALGSHDHGSHDHGSRDHEVAVVGTVRAWQIGATEAEIADAEKLVADTQAVVASFASVEDAESKGFVRINDNHMLYRDRVFDDKKLTPSAIESLVIGKRSDGEEYIMGGMYLMGLNETMSDVPRFGGPLMVWHTDGGFCFEPSGVITGGPEAGGTCPEGSVWLDDPPMLHIYSESQSDDGLVRTEEDCGTFTYMDLPLDQVVPGCGPGVVADHDHSGAEAHH